MIYASYWCPCGEVWEHEFYYDPLNDYELKCPNCNKLTYPWHKQLPTEEDSFDAERYPSAPRERRERVVQQPNGTYEIIYEYEEEYVEVVMTETVEEYTVWESSDDEDTGPDQG